MVIQILQYEFLGPVRLSEWGPPMEKTIYLVMSRKKDRFHVIYAGDCASTKEADYFTKNDRFKCWLENGGGEESLYLSILPMFEAGDGRRKGVLDRIVSAYAPVCNR